MCTCDQELIMGQMNVFPKLFLITETQEGNFLTDWYFSISFLQFFNILSLRQSAVCWLLALSCSELQALCLGCWHLTPSFVLSRLAFLPSMQNLFSVCGEGRAKVIKWNFLTLFTQFYPDSAQKEYDSNWLKCSISKTDHWL